MIYLAAIMGKTEVHYIESGNGSIAGLPALCGMESGLWQLHFPMGVTFNECRECRKKMFASGETAQPVDGSKAIPEDELPPGWLSA